MAIEKDIIINVEDRDALASIGNIDDGLQGLDKSADKGAKGVAGVSKAFKGLGTAIKAAGIGLVIGALAKLSEVFMQNQKVADLFNTTFEVLSIAFNDFVNFIIDNFGTVSDFFKDIFENPVDNIKAFGKAIKENIIERFNSALKTLGFLSSAVKKVFSGDFAGALEDVKSAGKESIDVLTGVNDSFDKGKAFIEESTEAISKYATETIKAARENVNLANSAELAAAQQSLLVEKYDIQAEKLRQIRDEERNSIEERKQANDDLLKVLEEQEKAMLAQADAQVAAAQAEINKNKSIENQVALTEALANKQGVLAQIEGFRSEQKSNDLALDREAIELTNSKLESENQLSIERQRFNAEQIEDEYLRLQRLQEIDLLEAEQEATRLQAIVDYANAGTQAKIDAQIALDEFLEESRQKNLTRKAEITEAEIALEAKKTAAKQKAVDDAIALAGAETKVGKALLILKQGLALKEMIMEAKKTIAFGSIAAAKSGVALAEGTAQTAKVGFPQNIPLLIGYAAQAAGIISAITSATGKAKSAASSFGGGGGGGTVSAPNTPAASIPPAFNVVGASGTSQLAEAIGEQEQQPVQAYVVANDVTTAQSMDRNIVEGASIG